MQHIAIEWAVTMLPVVLAGHGAGSFDKPFINGAPQIRCGRTLVVDFWIVRVEGVAPGHHASNGITEGNSLDQLLPGVEVEELCLAVEHLRSSIAGGCLKFGHTSCKGLRTLHATHSPH